MDVIIKDSYRASIASPDGNISPAPPVAAVVRGDWKSAPKIVRVWAYPLTWFGIVVLPFLFILVLIPDPNSSVARSATMLLYPLLFVFNVALNRGIKKGNSWAWTAQIPLSCFALLGFPIGTAIHAYILSQWFKPETKVWFGQS